MQHNKFFGEAIDKTKDYTDRRFEKQPRIKTNADDDKRYLDKAKFLSKWSCFDGYMQYVDTKWDGNCQGINYEDFKEKHQQNEINNRQSVRTNFYNNYLIEETLVKTVDCGGHPKQPFCLYDFTVKTFSHDCLNFSTRHMSRDMSSFIREDYVFSTEDSVAAQAQGEESK